MPPKGVFKPMIRNASLAIVVVALAIVAGCSGITPVTSPSSQGLTGTEWLGDTGGGKLLYGIWEVRVDSSGISTTEISDRDLAGHFNVKIFLKPPKCSDCITFSNVVDNSADQTLSADVTLKNPTALSAFDLRGIVISSNPAIYLANPDDYTKLYDKNVPAQINPFRRFGKSLTDGVVGPGVQVTEHFVLHYNAIPFIFKTAVDANFPLGSESEPYAIDNPTVEGNLDLTGTVSRMLKVTVLDRNDNVGAVSVFSDDLGLDFALNPDPEVEHGYFGWLLNANHAPAGDYNILISASDAAGGAPDLLYDYVTVTVSGVVGSWEKSVVTLPNTGCPRDVAATVDLVNGDTTVFLPGGTDCKAIATTTQEFTSPTPYFLLEDIDPQVPDFSPYPVARLDTSFAGGVAFFSSATGTYSDAYYTGPISSLMLTIYPDAFNTPQYTNPGDGDASRMYPSDPALTMIDVTDDMSGALYGLWADPAGTIPPELYGLTPDYTRHDVFMGGSLPPELVGSGEGMVSSDAGQLVAFDVSNVGSDSGSIYILESTGTNSEIEVISYAIDFASKITTYESVATIALGTAEVVDMDLAAPNPTYVPNPMGDSVFVLLDGPSGCWVKVFSATTQLEVQEIGGSSVPILTGIGGGMDMDNVVWQLIVLNQEGSAAALKWVV
jgi:hypothetical protein